MEVFLSEGLSYVLYSSFYAFVMIFSVILIYVLISFGLFIINLLRGKYRTYIFSQHSQVVSNLKNDKYYPTFYLQNCILQAAFPMFLQIPTTFYKREYIKTHDNVTISLDWVVTDEKKPLVWIVHGYTGGTDSTYMKSIIESLRYDYNIVCSQYRGLNDTPLSTNISFHGGVIEDSEFILEYLKSSDYVKKICSFKTYFDSKPHKYNELDNRAMNGKGKMKKAPNTDNKLYIIGISMGGNILTRILASKPSYYNKFVLGFVSVSNPFNLYDLQVNNTGNLYDSFLLKRCKSMVSTHAILKSNKNIRADKIHEIDKCADYNTHYSMKLYKEKTTFKDVDDYLLSISSYNCISKLDIPTLFINSEEDPLNSFTRDELEKLSIQNKNISFIVTSHGAHCTWTEGLYPTRWYEKITLKYLNLLNNTQILDKKNK